VFILILTMAIAQNRFTHKFLGVNHSLTCWELLWNVSQPDVQIHSFYSLLRLLKSTAYVHSIIFTKNQTQDCGDKNACYGLVSTYFNTFNWRINFIWYKYLHLIFGIHCIHSFWCSLLLKYVGLILRTARAHLHFSTIQTYFMCHYIWIAIQCILCTSIYKVALPSSWAICDINFCPVQSTIKNWKLYILDFYWFDNFNSVACIQF
jgi:hypothetical protein